MLCTCVRKCMHENCGMACACSRGMCTCLRASLSTHIVFVHLAFVRTGTRALLVCCTRAFVPREAVVTEAVMIMYPCMLRIGGCGLGMGNRAHRPARSLRGNELLLQWLRHTSLALFLHGLGEIVQKLLRRCFGNPFFFFF